MANATLRSTLIVSLIDAVTGPAAKVANSIRSINQAVTGGSAEEFGKRLHGAIERNNEALDKARRHLFDAVAGYYTLKNAIVAPVSAAADFETAMIDIGQKADIPVPKLKTLGDAIQDIGRRTNQSSMEIAKAVDTLIGFGASQDVALAAAAPIGQAATAYRAATEDLSKAVFAVNDNLKVPANQTAYALDILARAGKEGAFELKDMAKEFPALTAGAQFLGMKGVKSVADLAAALEVARKGAADGATAANNMANFIQKINSPQTIKNFAKMGVDVGAEMKKAVDEGISPIEHMLDIIGQLTNGDNAKLGQLFQDKQVQEFIKPLLANMDEYPRIRDEALASQGTVEKDFTERLNTALGVQQRFANAMQNLQIAIGDGLVPVLTRLADAIVPIMSKIEQWTADHPKLTSAILMTVGALIALRVATFGLTFAGLLGKGGALELLSIGFNTVGRAAIGAKVAVSEMLGLQTALAAAQGVKYGGLAMLADGMTALALAVPGVGLVTDAVVALGAAIAGITAPVWAAGAAIAALVLGGGLVLYKYWDRISSFVSGFASAIGDKLAPALNLLRPILDPVSGAVGGLGDAIGRATNAISGFFSMIFSREIGTEAQKAEWSQAGADLANAMVDAIKSALGGLVGWAAGLGAQIGQAISSAAVAAIDNLKSAAAGVLNPWGVFGGGAPAPAGSKITNANPMASQGPSGHRARGGPIWPGGSFLVGEKEPEVITPNGAATVTPLSKAAGTVVNLTVNVSGVAGDARELAQEVARRASLELRSVLRGIHADEGARG